MNAIGKDLLEVYTGIENSGFVCPPKVYVKNDHRGEDYGRWEVGVRDSDNIRVSYHSGHGEEYNFTLFFRDVGDFKKWALHTT